MKIEDTNHNMKKEYDPEPVPRDKVTTENFKVVYAVTKPKSGGVKKRLDMFIGPKKFPPRWRDKRIG